MKSTDSFKSLQTNTTSILQHDATNKRICINLNSGKCHLLYISNYDEICLSDLSICEQESNHT